MQLVWYLRANDGTAPASRMLPSITTTNATSTLTTMDKLHLRDRKTASVY